MEEITPTNEESKTSEPINQHEQQKLDTTQCLDDRSLNLTDSDTVTQAESQESQPELTANEASSGKNQNTLEYGEVKDKSDQNQVEISPREYENQVLAEVVNLLTTETPQLLYEVDDDIEEDEEMSKSNVKVKTPNKTNSRSNLPHGVAKVPAELSGQPSVKSTKEDVKYWKSREQELLEKISVLENKIGGTMQPKFYGPIDQVAAQRQEKLEEDLSATAKEKENYKNRLQMIEKELYAKQKEQSKEPNTKNMKNAEEVINHLKTQNEELKEALTKMTAILRDKTGLCVSQEKKLAALTNQVESLKEVIAITKDLLNIRNMEVQHLSNDIASMESKIDCERQRHNQMLLKMDEAVRLNSELKKEYENQLKIFQQLRDNYEEKVRLLTRDHMPMDNAEQCTDGIRAGGTNENTKRSSTSPSRVPNNRGYSMPYPDS